MDNVKEDSAENEPVITAIPLLAPPMVFQKLLRMKHHLKVHSVI
jgi:hypothetical protein